MIKLDNPIQVTKTFLPPINEYIEEIRKIWDTNWVTNNGPIHQELEEKLKGYLKARNTTLFTNGHSALDIAIKASKLTGEVITTPFTFASTTHAIVMNNLTPVFCDIKKNNFTIDENRIEEMITNKTSAIIPVHVFGYPCNVKKIEEIAKKHNLNVIYDAAHAFGVEIQGKGIGNFGDISMFSLHGTKVYHSIEGGLLTTNNENLKHELTMLKNFGITGEESVEEVGLNAKMNEFQAAMGIVNLRYIDSQINNRKIAAQTYRENLKGIRGISFLEDEKNTKHNYSYFPIIINESDTGISRNYMYDKLKEFNVFTRKYFYPLTTDYSCYKNKYNNEKLENAKYVADRILTLPMSGQITKEDVCKISMIIKYIVNEYNK